MRVLFAKGSHVRAIATVVGMVTAFGAFFVVHDVLAHHHMATNLGQPGVLRAVLGGGLYVLACGMFGLALGTVIRHTAGAITAVVALLFVVPPLTGLLPGTWGDDIEKYFMSNAGQHITEVVRIPGHMAPWLGYLVITIWWVVPLIAGAWMMQKRDA